MKLKEIAELSSDFDALMEHVKTVLMIVEEAVDAKAVELTRKEQRAVEQVSLIAETIKYQIDNILAEDENDTGQG